MPEKLILAHTLALEESPLMHSAPSAVDIGHDQRRRVEEILQRLVWVS